MTSKNADETAVSPGRRAVEARIVAETGLTSGETRDIVDQIAALLSASLAAGEPLKLYGFGTFFFDDRPEHERWDPIKGGFRTIPAKRHVRFRPSEYMACRLNKKPMRVWSGGVVRPRKYDPERDET